MQYIVHNYTWKMRVSIIISPYKPWWIDRSKWKRCVRLTKSWGYDIPGLVSQLLPQMFPHHILVLVELKLETVLKICLYMYALFYYCKLKDYPPPYRVISHNVSVLYLHLVPIVLPTYCLHTYRCIALTFFITALVQNIQNIIMHSYFNA